MAQVHLVAIDREDLPLGVPLFDLNGKHHFLELALERLLVGEAELLLEVPRELLRQRARALGPAALDDVGDRDYRDPHDVDASVPIDIVILLSDYRQPMPLSP